MVDIKVPKQLNPGRPRSATNKAAFEPNSELPKEIIGSHMGMMHPAGPAIKNPIKPIKGAPKAPKS